MSRFETQRASLAQILTVAVLLGGLLALPLAATPAPQPLAGVEVTSTLLTFQPLIEHEGVRVTVSGPNGFQIVETFQAGETPSIELPGKDGFYKYELRFSTAIDSRERTRLRLSRADGTGSYEPTREARDTVQSGWFTVKDGAVVSDRLREIEPKVVLTNGDGVIRNSLCVGFDCPDAPVFSDSTILLMENNTRIKFGDTSNNPFPNNDWEIEANSSLSGGANYLGFNDCGTADNDGGCADDVVFAVEAGARRSALYVESDGDIGIGTSNPVVDIHLVTGNTPTLRLDQDGSSGFAPQVWDVAGNETNFFVRDVTGGSLLPFRIRPGAPTSSIDIAASGNVGLGTSSPQDTLHIQSPSSANATIRYVNGDATADFWRLGLNPSEDFVINYLGDATAELRVSKAGGVFVSGTQLNVPDYVFAPDYRLMSLAELGEYVRANRHLPNVGSAQEVMSEGIDLTRLPLQLLEKVEELTLYTLQQQKAIDQQQQTIEELLQQKEALASRLAALEAK